MKNQSKTFTLHTLQLDIQQPQTTHMTTTALSITMITTTTTSRAGAGCAWCDEALFVLLIVELLVMEKRAKLNSAIVAHGICWSSTYAKGLRLPSAKRQF